MEERTMTLTNKVYDVIKWVAQYLLPAIGTLYFAIAQIWSLPYGEQVVGTITAIDAFLGAILGISSKNYQGEGTFNIDTRDELKDVIKLDLDTPIEDIAKQNKIQLKVNYKS